MKRRPPEPEVEDDEYETPGDPGAYVYDLDEEARRLAEVDAKAHALLANIERRLGLRIRASRPGDEPPRLPVKLTQLSSRELSNLYGQYAAWAEYVGDELALARVVKTMVQEETTQANARARLEGKKDEAIVACELDRRVLCIAEARVELLQPKLTAWEQCIHVLSREQTRRDSEQNMNGGRR